MIGKILFGVLAILAAYFIVLIASGFVDFALQWFVDFRIRPYISVPLFWLFGIIGSAARGIVNAIFSSHSQDLLRSYFVTILIGAAPHLIFRFVVLPMQISYRWLVISMYVSMLAITGISIFGSWKIFDATFITPMPSGGLADGIDVALNYKYSIAFLIAIIVSQIIGYSVVRKIRHVRETNLGEDALEAAETVMELTTLVGKKMGYIKMASNHDYIMHWALQKGNGIVYPFFPGAGGGSHSGDNTDVNIDF